MRDTEHKLQVTLVNWFRIQYREYQGLLFAIPNGGQRNVVVAAKLKAEGVMSGVADMLLCVSRKGYHGLFIEVKVAKKYSHQSESQRIFQSNVEKEGYLYVVVRSLNDFMQVINNYLR